ncbi:hypothetical protein BC830DRAFT_1170440 [Chytriomyces sp. MP71]|nr:hypothetical protein BC830DRAFT_1170440 [Chytriomyces sp. MP71]
MASKAVAGGKKKKKVGGKGSKMSAKKKKGSAENEEEVLTLRKANLSKVKAAYPLQCKKFISEPIQSVVKRIDKAVASIEDIDKIIITSTSLTPSDIWSLYETFESYKALVAVCLWTCPLDLRALEALAKFAVHHPTLTTLHLIDCRISPHMCTYLGTIARESKTLSTLVLDHNGIGAAGAVELFRGLQRNLFTNPEGVRVMRVLSLRYCDVGSKAAEVIAGTIETHNGLTFLDISGNAIGDEGLIPIAKGLAKNTALKTLNLSANNIQNRTGVLGEQAPLALSPMLVSSRPTTNNVPHRPTSMAVLCSILAAENTGLVYLDLTGNHVGAAGGQLVLEMLKLRKPLAAGKKCEALQVELTERLGEELYGDVCDLNDVMDDLAKKNAKGAGKGKKGKKGK